MTIVIALACSDGVLMASDSQAIEPTAGVRYEVPKIFGLTDQAVWGGSGDSQTISEIDRALQANRAAITASADLANDLAMTIRPVLQRRYATVIQAPAYQAPQPATAALACGFHPDGGSWIVEVDPNCTSTHYGARGFHAIGSAAGFALLGNALLAHFKPAERPLAHGQLIAYRVINAAIETSMFGVGGKIQMWYVDKDGVHQVQPDELAETRSIVGAWQDEEGKALDRVLGSLPSAVEPEPTPIPEPTQD